MLDKLNKLQGQNNDGMIKLRRALKMPQNAPFKTALRKFKSAANAITELQNREGTHKLSFRIVRGRNIINNKNKPQHCRKSHTVSRISLHSAINEHLFHQLKRKVRKMTSKKKICILQFENISLSTHLRRSVRHKNIYHQALVFTVRGVKTDYVQPISYIFFSSTTPVIDLSTQIKLIISKLQAIGLTTIATVCNCSNLNVCTIDWLIRDTMKQYLRQGKLLGKNIFEVNGEEIIPLYNPRHLMKVLRNNLMDHNLRYELEGEVRVGKWEHVVALYNQEVGSQYKLLPLLTEKHVYPNRVSRSSVDSAIEVVNCEVGAVMGFIMNIQKIQSEFKDTVKLFFFFGTLFDSLDMTYIKFNTRSRKPRVGLITPKSTRKEIWAESKNILRTMEFCSNGESRVLSISNWLQTVENMEYLVELLLTEYKVSVERWKKFNPFVTQPKVLKKFAKRYIHILGLISHHFTDY